MESSWNYKRDLELLDHKLSKCSHSKKIHSMITSILEVEIETANPSENSICDEPNSSSTIPYTESLPQELSEESSDLDSSLITDLIRLMLQFQKDYFIEGRRTLPMNSIVKKHFLDVSWSQLETVWTAFGFYFKKSQELNDMKSPFEIDTVMQKILNYLPTKDALNCRRVCHAWNDKVLELDFRKREHCIIEVSDNGEISRFCNEIDVISPLLLRRLRILISGFRTDECSTFFSKYGQYVKELYVYDRANDDSSGLSSELDYQANLRSVFQNSAHVENLIISKTRVPQAGTGLPFVFSPEELKTFNLPNVRSMTIYIGHELSSEFAEGLFSMLPNLKILDITCPESINETSRIVAALDGLSLNSLSCYMNLQANFWTSLESQQLKVLNIRARRRSDNDMAGSEKFFETQRTTLKSLALSHPLGLQTTRTFQFPYIDNLHTLEFREYPAYFRSLAPGLVPTLQSISCEMSRLKLHFQEAAFRTVVELKMTDVSVPERVKWETLGDMFPNLKVLKLTTRQQLNNPARGSPLSDLFQSFSKLEKLDLCIVMHDPFENYKINHFLSGFTSETESVMTQLTRLKSTEWMHIDPPRPSLRDMKRLKSLNLDLRSDRSRAQVFAFDDVDIQLGLMRIQRLDKFSMRGQFTISEASRKMLESYHYRVSILPV